MRRVREKNQVRIFVGTTEIAGYYAYLSQGFRELGYICDYVSFSDHPFKYGGESKNFLLLQIKKLILRRKSAHLFVAKLFYLLAFALMKIIWIIYIILRYDVYIFGFGTSLTIFNIDLPVLRILRKLVISNLAHGSEARPPYIDGSYQSKSGEMPSLRDIYKITKLTKRKVRLHQKCASILIGAPFSTSHFIDRPFINHFALGLPFLTRTEPTASRSKAEPLPDDGARSIRILHSPSHPAAKGSPQIVQTISNLQNKGYNIDFVLIHGKPNREVLEEIAQCDFVIDQIYSDTPMAAFAMEAAWFGKPAVVGGYGLDRLRSFVPEGMWPPSLTCHPDEIERAIEYLITHPEARMQLGEAAQRFVQEKWSAVEVAKRYLRIIEGDIPDEWWLDPRQVLYLEGFGQPVERTKEVIRAMVEKYGKESLHLDHRPDLLSAFLEFAEVRCQENELSKRMHES